MAKTRIFVDFWNLQLSLNEKAGRKFWLDWTCFPSWLMSEASGLVGNKLDYDGTKVYLSYDPKVGFSSIAISLQQCILVGN